jgi:hypothetical protein
LLQEESAGLPIQPALDGTVPRPMGNGLLASPELVRAMASPDGELTGTPGRSRLGRRWRPPQTATHPHKGQPRPMRRRCAPTHPRSPPSSATAWLPRAVAAAVSSAPVCACSVPRDAADWVSPPAQSSCAPGGLTETLVQTRGTHVQGLCPVRTAALERSACVWTMSWLARTVQRRRSRHSRCSPSHKFVRVKTV